ncbi:hypothetical protein [Paludibaculum fermentans]|uniref:hypothetical protein n=1 Tax=Paludibaculum fermentans TaxID=1473598 RepID=UPI003EB9FB89
MPVVKWYPVSTGAKDMAEGTSKAYGFEESNAPCALSGTLFLCGAKPCVYYGGRLILDGWTA